MSATGNPVTTPSTSDAPRTGVEAGVGSLEAIWIKRVRRGPMDPHDRARLVAGRGIEGNANQGGKRQVTIIEAERWREANAELGVEVDPRARRANLMVSGVDLRESRGRTLRIGDCRIAIRGETRPCRLLDDAQPGLREALANDWRAGVYGEVLDDGEIAVGDRVAWEE